MYEWQIHIGFYSAYIIYSFYAVSESSFVSSVKMYVANFVFYYTYT